MTFSNKDNALLKELSKNTMADLLEFIHLSERLKIENRNGRTSQGNHESVADHCWRVALMVIILGPSLDKKINIEKALKLAIIHDLAEIITGDSPYFHYLENDNNLKEKHINEAKALESLVSKLPKNLRNEISDLWHEFEEKSSNEALFIHALDKMEAQIQHNEASFQNWNEYDIKYAPTLLDKYCQFDVSLNEFKTLVQAESKKKIKDNENQSSRTT